MLTATATNMPLHNLQPSPWDELDAQPPREANEFEREDLLEDVEHAFEVAVRDGRVLVRTRRGACIIRVDNVRGARIVLFDHIELDPRTRTGSHFMFTRRTFWFNEHSVKATGEKLRKLPRRAWTDLLMEIVL